MSTNKSELIDLANQGESSTLEDRWLNAIDNQDSSQEDMLDTLSILIKNDQTEFASTLAWTWLAYELEKSDPNDCLALGKELLLRCTDNDEIRQEVLRLYKDVYSEKPHIEQLIQASGLSGAKTPLRAIRTMDICLDLKEGDFLISRSEERAAEVIATDRDLCMYTVRSTQGEQLLDPDELALTYDPVEANDFRVLIQLYPERLHSIIDTDPVTLVIGILRSRQGQIDSDELEHLLTSNNYLSPDKWKSWWSKAKTQLKRCPNIVVEGRNRTILTYHKDGQTLEDEIEPAWAQADTPAQRIEVINTYFREIKLRKTRVQPAMVKRMYSDLLTRVNALRKGSPADALTEALIIDLLAEGAELPEDATGPAREILAESTDCVALISSLKKNSLYLRALRYTKEDKPEDWPAIYARLLPLAPIAGCDFIAETLLKEGKTSLLAEAVKMIPTDFSKHLDAVCWLWRKPPDEVEEPISARELLIKLLDHLGDVTRGEDIPAEVVRETRQLIRSALSADKYKRYQEVIKDMEAGLASTVYNQAKRIQGLGQTVRSTILNFIQKTHPELFIKEKVDPWLDDNAIYCTQEGMNKCQEDLNFIVNVKMKENAKAIGEAASHGDLSENSEYKFALEERDLLQARAARMQDALSRARILTPQDISCDKINIGTRVSLRRVDSEQQKDITILGPWESDIDKGIYNYRAPLCAKLKDLTVGDTVTLNLGDAEAEYRIESINNAIES